MEGNVAGKCDKCHKTIKSYNGLTGLHCRWCHTKVSRVLVPPLIRVTSRHFQLHNRCASQVSPDCRLGPYRTHVLPPTSICPTVLDRQRSMVREKCRDKVIRTTNSCVDIGPGSPGFQISPEPDCHPLLVFVNPKSGGRQGAKLYRKFLYHLNPRQVYNLANGGPKAGLSMFRDVENVIIVVCGGDGTVGWVLESLGKTCSHWDIANWQLTTTHAHIAHHLKCTSLLNSLRLSMMIFVRSQEFNLHLWHRSRCSQSPCKVQPCRSDNSNIGVK